MLSHITQGNLFANYADKYIVEHNYLLDKSIMVVGVANPAGKTVYNNLYVTAHDDLVIDALNFIYEVLE